MMLKRAQIRLGNIIDMVVVKKGLRRSVQVRSGMFQVWQVRPLRKRMQIGKLLQLWQGRSYSKILSIEKKRRKIFSQRKTARKR